VKICERMSNFERHGGVYCLYATDCSLEISR
jgi:hypothetical protein